VIAIIPLQTQQYSKRYNILWREEVGVLKIGQNIGDLEVFAHTCITAEVKNSMPTYT